MSIIAWVFARSGIDYYNVDPAIGMKDSLRVRDALKRSLRGWVSNIDDTVGFPRLGSRSVTSDVRQNRHLALLQADLRDEDLCNLGLGGYYYRLPLGRPLFLRKTPLIPFRPLSGLV